MSFASTKIVVPPVVDAAGQVIVNGPVSSRKTSKSFVFKVTNVGGTAPITINPANDITSSVTVNADDDRESVSVAGLAR